jgi:myosin protein heavy chain
LEKQIKELGVRIVDLETKAYTSKMASKSEAIRLQRTGDAKSAGSKSRHEEEIIAYEARMTKLRETIAELVSVYLRL